MNCPLRIRSLFYNAIVFHHQLYNPRSLIPSQLIVSRNFSTELKPNLEVNRKKWYPLDKDNEESKFSKFFEEYLSHELSIDPETAKRIYFLHQDKIGQHYPNNDSLIQLCNFLKMSFTSECLSHNPKLFTLSFDTIYNRVLILKELGFRSFNVSMMESTEYYLRLTMGELRKYQDYSSKQTCLDNMCKIMDIYGDDREKLIQHIDANYKDIESISISELRMLCTAKYLSVFLQIGFNRGFQMCRKYSRHMNEISLTALKQNVNYLKEELKYSNGKIINYGLFLLINSENLKNFFTKLKPVIGGYLFHNIVSMPHLLKIDYNQLLDNYNLIKSKCDGRFFSRSIPLMVNEPAKLAAIFEKIEQDPVIQKLNLPMLGLDLLALNKQKIFQRIETLKREQVSLNNVPISFFIESDSQFEDALADLISDPELRIRSYLENYFHLDYEKVKHRIYTISNITTDRYSPKNANQIVEFFISMNVEKELIIESIYLILFEYKQVKTAYFNACNRYEKLMHKDPDFFKYIFEFLQFIQNSSRND